MIAWFVAAGPVVTGQTGSAVSGRTSYTTEVRVFTTDKQPIGGALQAAELVVPMACVRVSVCCVP